MTRRAAHAIVQMLVAAAVLAATSPAQSQFRDSHSSPDVGALSGEMAVFAEDGREVGSLEATTTWSAAQRSGMASMHFVPVGGGNALEATAQVFADSPHVGFGAVTAIVAKLAGRPLAGGSSLRLANLRVDGDVAALRQHAVEIAAWWDAQAGLAVAGYVSPLPILTKLSRLQLNVWGIETSPTGGEMRGYATLLFDPADPETAIGGRIVRRSQFGHYQFLDLPLPFSNQLTLTPITETAAPNDFRLCTASCQHFDPVRAELVIDVLEDGTVDVRGVADQWLHGEGAFTVEGTGNPSLAPPGS